MYGVNVCGVNVYIRLPTHAVESGRDKPIEVSSRQGGVAAVGDWCHAWFGGLAHSGITSPFHEDRPQSAHGTGGRVLGSKRDVHGMAAREFEEGVGAEGDCVYGVASV